jgi:hypothetical protein
VADQRPQSVLFSPGQPTRLAVDLHLLSPEFRDEPNFTARTDRQPKQSIKASDLLALHRCRKALQLFTLAPP